MSGFELHVDSFGFPVVRFSSLEADFHWLPLTKIQLEYVICDHPGSHFDGDWYEGLLKQNPRVAPEEISSHNYWRAFATGLLPNEAETVAAWMGDNWRVPALEEWKAMYDIVRSAPATDIDWDNLGGLNERAKKIVARLKSVMRPASTASGGPWVADRMLVRGGVLEWVACHQTGKEAWGLLGQPVPAFEDQVHVNLDWGDPHFPASALRERHASFGVRLIRKSR